MKFIGVIVAFSVLVLLAGCVPESIKEKFVIPQSAQAPQPAQEPNPVTGDASSEVEEPVEEELSEEGVPVKQVVEGELVEFPNLKATDPDGDRIAYTFSKPLDTKTGRWQTKVGDAGTYDVTITASDGKNEVEQSIRIIVDPKNRPPVIEKLADISVNEGETVDIVPVVSDPDGDTVTISYSGWMKSNTFETGYNDAGDHLVTVSANDGTTSAKESVKVVVKNVNRPPELMSLKDVSIKEGDKVTVVAKATDPDKDKVTVTFSEPLDNKGIWQSGDGDAGKYQVTVTATDGDLEVSETFTLDVASVNKPPKLMLAQKIIEVDEGETVRIEVSAEDPENDSVTIKFSGWMSSDNYTTDFEDSGSHKVTVSATDGINTVSEDVTVIVRDVNRPPQFVEGSFE